MAPDDLTVTPTRFSRALALSPFGARELAGSGRSRSAQIMAPNATSPLALFNVQIPDDSPELQTPRTRCHQRRAEANFLKNTLR